MRIQLVSENTGFSDDPDAESGPRSEESFKADYGTFTDFKRREGISGG